MNIIHKIMNIFDRITTGHHFADGTKISILHKYALLLEKEGRAIEVGFEQALESNVDRLIHEDSISHWISSVGVDSVTPVEKAEILKKVEQYCVVKGFTYRIVGAS